MYLTQQSYNACGFAESLNNFILIFTLMYFTNKILGLMQQAPLIILQLGALRKKSN